MVSERVVCREFVGRALELEHLRARRRAAAEGRGGLVLIAGEPGIGKSRLVHEFCAHLAPARHRIATGACREFAQRPFEPLAHILRGARGSSPFDERAGSREEQFASVIAAFDRMASGPVAILTLEDLHWADAELLATLELLSQRAQTRRVLLTGTYREDEIVPGHPLFTAFGRILRRDGVSLLTLGPLSDEEGRRFLAGALPATARVEPDTLRDVLMRSGGNPLFTEELLRHVVDGERSGHKRTARSLPLSVRAVVRERLDRCTPAERNVLAQAALLGRRFRSDLLADAFEVPAETLIAPLQRLCELQLLDVREDELFGFQFRHALTRDAVYAEMLPEQTRPLHARIARALAARPDAAVVAEVIAHNFWEAGEREAAAPHCELAGDVALALFAYEDAAAWYRRAADGRSSDDAEAGRLLGKAAEVLLRADAVDRLLPVREAAAQAFMRAGQIERAINERNYALGALGNEGRIEAARAYGAQTLAMIPAENRELSDRTAIRLAALEASTRATERAARHLEAVDQATLQRGDIAIEYFAVRAAVHAQRGEFVSWRAAASRALDLAEGVETLWLRRWLPGNLAVSAYHLGDLETARTLQARSLAIAQEHRLDLTYSYAVMAQIELRAGNVAAAKAYVDRTSPAQELLPRLQRVQAAIGVASALGDREALERLLDLELVPALGAGGNRSRELEARAALATALEGLGRSREAAALLENAAPMVVHPFGLADAIVTIARLVPAHAAVLRERLRAAAQRTEDGIAVALYALVDARPRHAAEAFEALGWPLFAARAFEAAGDTTRAQQIYAACGAGGFARRLERAAYSRERAAAGVLTEREHAIAGLVAGGKGNRATAAALSISEKSVEKSLTSIYAKLGLRSRTELAAYMARSS